MAEKGNKRGDPGVDVCGKEMEGDEQKGGGHECELLKQLGKEVQSECPVCLLVLRDPHVVTCCGKTFCEVCITRLKKAKTRCPTCNAWEFTSEPDDKLRATLDEIRVRCGNGRAGCQWEGRLRDLGAHLNLSPTLSDYRSSGCEFAGIECGFCGERYKRLYILEHESQNCLKRPHTCSECQLKGTYETITKVHWFECQRSALNSKLDGLQKSRLRSGWCGSPWLLAFLVAVGAVTIAAVLSDPSSGSDEFRALQEKVKALEDELVQYRQTVGVTLTSLQTHITHILSSMTIEAVQSSGSDKFIDLQEQLKDEFARYRQTIGETVVSLETRLTQTQEKQEASLNRFGSMEASLAGLKSELNSIDILRQSVESASTKLHQYSATVAALETKLQQSATDYDKKLREEREQREKEHNDVMVIIGEMKKHRDEHHHHHHGHGGCHHKKGRRGRGR